MLTGKGTRQTKKKCVKATAYSCKYACILRSKKCRNPLENSQAKDFVLWLTRQEEQLAKVNAHRVKSGRTQFALTQSKLGLVKVEPNPAITKQGDHPSRGQKENPKTKKIGDWFDKQKKTSANKAEATEATSIEKTVNQQIDTRTTKKVTPRDFHNRNLYGIAMGRGDSRDLTVVARQAKIMIERNKNNIQQKKIERLKNAGLSDYEANGLAVWIGSDYEAINKVIYDGSIGQNQYRDFGESSGVFASLALRKLPPYQQSEIEKEAVSKGFHLLKGGILERHIEIKEKDMDLFLKPYQDAIKTGEYREPSFFAATMIEEAGFEDANVKYIIKPKSDGNGQGRAIDKFKNNDFEGEILYPPYSRFKVLRVERTSPYIQVALSQRKYLPEKYRNLTEEGLLSERENLEELKQSIILAARNTSPQERSRQIKLLNLPIKDNDDMMKVAFAINMMFRPIKGKAVIHMEEL